MSMARFSASLRCLRYAQHTLYVACHAVAAAFFHATPFIFIAADLSLPMLYEEIRRAYERQVC